jgi:hypothetical protein
MTKQRTFERYRARFFGRRSMAIDPSALIDERWAQPRPEPVSTPAPANRGAVGPRRSTNVTGA